MSRKAEKIPNQQYLFPMPDAPEAGSGTEIMPFRFEQTDVPVYLINGEPWWRAVDVCRVLGLEQVSRATSRLDDDEKGVTSSNTLGGRQDVVIINEPGLYNLILSSRKPEAKQFKRWVTHIVLPALRKGKPIPNYSSRVRKVAKRLGIGMALARDRVENMDENIRGAGRLASSKATREDYRAWHNSGYLGQFGVDAAGLRKPLGLKPHQTPLDRMDRLPLTANTHAKALAERKAQELRDLGQDVSAEEQCRILFETAQMMAREDLAMMGPDYRYGIREDDRLGKRIDVVRKQLEA
jgi:prophage antirepressor-like protein